jgi:hypothetical protein
MRGCLRLQDDKAGAPKAKIGGGPKPKASKKSKKSGKSSGKASGKASKKSAKDSDKVMNGRRESPLSVSGMDCFALDNVHWQGPCLGWNRHCPCPGWGVVCGVLPFRIICALLTHGS